MPGSLQSVGRRVGRITANQSMGGMTLGEEAAAVGECSLLVTFCFERELGPLLLNSSTEVDQIARLNVIH